MALADASSLFPSGGSDPRKYGGRVLPWLAQFLPPAPPDHETIEAGDLRGMYEATHWRRAAAFLAPVLAGSYALLHFVPATRFSVALLLLAPIEEFLRSHLLVIEAILISLMVLIWVRMHGRSSGVEAKEAGRRIKGGFRSLLNHAALAEEQMFREGAETWTWTQRAWSCALFGAVHFVSLIVPIAMIPLLALAGVFFMGVYLSEYRRTGDRRAATIEAAVTHRAYNTLAFTWMIGATLVSTGWSATGW